MRSRGNRAPVRSRWFAQLEKETCTVGTLEISQQDSDEDMGVHAPDSGSDSDLRSVESNKENETLSVQEME